MSVSDEGLVKRYVVSKADGSATDPRAFYFVLRLDEFGTDPEHIAACRCAARCYAANAPKHLAKMAKELNDMLDAFGAPKIGNNLED